MYVKLQKQHQQKQGGGGGAPQQRKQHLLESRAYEDASFASSKSHLPPPPASSSSSSSGKGALLFLLLLPSVSPASMMVNFFSSPTYSCLRVSYSFTTFFSSPAQNPLGKKVNFWVAVGVNKTSFSCAAPPPSSAGAERGKRVCFCSARPPPPPPFPLGRINRRTDGEERKGGFVGSSPLRRQMSLQNRRRTCVRSAPGESPTPTEEGGGCRYTSLLLFPLLSIFKERAPFRLAEYFSGGLRRLI